MFFIFRVFCSFIIPLLWLLLPFLLRDVLLIVDMITILEIYKRSHMTKFGEMQLEPSTNFTFISCATPMDTMTCFVQSAKSLLILETFVQAHQDCGVSCGRALRLKRYSSKSVLLKK